MKTTEPKRTLIPGRVKTRKVVFTCLGREFDVLGAPMEDNPQTALGFRRKYGDNTDKIHLLFEER